MCGIAGVISWSESHRTSRATLARMSAAIAHRGPDGEGIYFDRDPDDLTQPIMPDRPQVALAFRRLAVLDPTAASDQPFVSTDGRYVMVFNGEIYNFKDLKSEISNLKSDYVWRTKGDTEVVMMAYTLWGERCVERFNGMFAIAVWDHQQRSLFLARDRMGQKPLYFSAIDADGKPWSGVSATHANGVKFEHEDPARRADLFRKLSGPSSTTIRFASEIGALATFDAIDSDTNSDRLNSYLQTGASGQIETATKGIQSMPPRTVLQFDDDSFVGWAYFDAALADGTGYQPEMVAKRPPNHGLVAHATKRAVELAVERQLVSDVPLGVFLSGGVDSSVIALCARKHGPVKTFSIGFDDPRYDETKYAAEVAKHLGTDHHEFQVTPNVIEDLPKLAAVFGEPFADSSALPTHYLARETRKHVTVALSGDGGDELFGGYDRYLAMQKASGLPRFVGVFIAPIGRVISCGHPKSKLARAGRFLSTLGLPPAGRYDALMRVFDDPTIDALLDSGGRQSSAAISDRHTNGGRGLPPSRWGTVAAVFEREFHRTRNVVTAALATDRVTYLPDDLLTKVDRCSMLHGLEVRSPFMDHELVELAAQLTEEQLLKGGKKRMLREAFAGELPASVFNRPKMGFAVPIGEWFRGPLRSFLHDHLFATDSFARAHFKMPVVERLVDEHETERRDHSQRLYALLMLELWWDLQKTPPPPSS